MRERTKMMLVAWAKRVMDPLADPRLLHVHEKAEQNYLSTIRSPVRQAQFHSTSLNVLVTTRGADGREPEIKAPQRPEEPEAPKALTEGLAADGAGALPQEQPNVDISPSDFESILWWMQRFSRPFCSLIGQEPTVHPQFRALLELCRKFRMPIFLTTKGLYDDEVRRAISPNLFKRITINFRGYPSLGSPERRHLEENLRDIHRSHIPSLWFSYPLDEDDDEDWTRMVDLAVENRVQMVQIVLPSHKLSGETSPWDIRQKLRIMARKCLEILKTLTRLKIAGTIAHPVLSCMFGPGEWNMLRKMGPGIAVTRCRLGFKGNYGIMLTVGPDMRTHPCPKLKSIRGANLLEYQGNTAISDAFRKPVEKLILKPLTMEACQGCGSFSLSKVALKHCLPGVGGEGHFDTQLCQGGCLAGRSS